MSIFESSTIPESSPEVTGQEQEGTEVQQETQDQAQETTEVESGADAAEETEETPSEEAEQGVQQQFDYEKAYRELRSDYTRKTQRLAELERHYQQFQQPPQQQMGQGQPNMEQLRAQLEEGLQNDPVGTVARLADAIAAQKVETIKQEFQRMVNPLYETQIQQQYNQNMNTLAQTYPELRSEEGYQAFLNALNNIAHEIGNPNIVSNPPLRVLKMAAQEIFGDRGTKLYQKAKAKGKQEALETIKAKQGLSAPVGTKPKEQPKSIEDQIADAIVAAGRSGGIFG